MLRYDHRRIIVLLTYHVYFTIFLCKLHLNEELMNDTEVPAIRVRVWLLLTSTLMLSLISPLALKAY